MEHVQFNQGAHFVTLSVLYLQLIPLSYNEETMKFHDEEMLYVRPYIEAFPIIHRQISIPDLIESAAASRGLKHHADFTAE